MKNVSMLNWGGVLFCVVGLVLLLACSALSNQSHAQESLIEWQHLSTEDGQLPIPGQATQQTASLILDIDRDGNNDFVVGSRQGSFNSLVWYRRDQGGWTLFTIEDEVLDIEAGGTYHDIDQDGDLDIVMGGDYQSNQVWWWENPYPDYTSKWNRRLIKSGGANKHHDQMFGDFDGDGQTELVFWNQNGQELILADIPADPRTSGTWPQQTIYSWSGGGEHEGFAFADIDLDGLDDIVGGGRWFKYNSNNTYTPNIIDDEQGFTRAAAGQLKQGGRPEVVFVVGDGVGPLKWYEWNESANAWDSTILLDSVDHGHSLAVEDVDEDGNLDIFVAEMRLNGRNSDAKIWILLGDGDGNFTETTVATGYGNHESRLADLDGDGDLDILGKPYNWETPRLDIWINGGLKRGDSMSAQWVRHVVDEDRPWRAVFVTAADVDGDSLPDLLTGGWWYQNPGQLSGVWPRSAFGQPLNNLAAVYDFDKDGDLDVLGTAGQGSEANSRLVWAENDGRGQFTIHENIEPAVGDFLQGVAVLPMADVSQHVALSWHEADVGVQTVTIPDDPVNTVWRWEQLSAVSQDEALSAGDIDGDGDHDLLLGTIWLQQNDDGWQAITLQDTNDAPDRNRLADINGDGRLDAVVGFEAISVPGQLVWYEQGVDPNAGWTMHPIADPPIIGPMSLDVADIDDDGDLDVVAGEHNTEQPESASLYIFYNIDGAGLTWESQLVHQGDEHHDGAQLVDIDDDGDLDIISIGWTHDRVLLYENLSRQQEPRDVQSNAGESVPTSPATSAPEVIIEPVIESNGGLCTVDHGLIASYTFDEGAGSIVQDISAIDPPLDLLIEGDGASWLPDGGLVINTETQISTSGPAAKITEAVQASGALGVEVWLKPAHTNQDGPARIVTLSSDEQHRNFTLGQGQWGDLPKTVYDMRIRTTAADDNGMPSLTTPEDTVIDELTHIVYTYDAAGNRRLYVNAEQVAADQVTGSFNNWDVNYRLALGNEINGNRPWLGELHYVALFDCPLSEQDIMSRFSEGPKPAQPDPAPETSDEVSEILSSRPDNSDDGLQATPAADIAQEEALDADDHKRGSAGQKQTESIPPEIIASEPSAVERENMADSEGNAPDDRLPLTSSALLLGLGVIALLAIVVVYALRKTRKHEAT